MPDGSINYNCPCVGSAVGLLTGPCGQEFRDWHACVLKSDANGQDCMDKLANLKGCFGENYAMLDEEGADEEERDPEPASTQKNSPDQQSDSAHVKA